MVRWQIGFGYWLGLIGLAVGIWVIASGQESAWWLLAWLVVHHFNTMIVSAGLHRYFSHGAFKTTKFWHNFMAYYSATMLYASPYAWSTVHVTHHVHSDTDRDPHVLDWRYLLFKQFREVPMVMSRFKKIAGDPTLDFVHRHGFFIWFVVAATLLAISPTFFLFAYLMPLGTIQLFGVIHQMISHRKDGGARDFPLLEYVFPTGGEWHHKYHHDHPGRVSFRSKWWHLDMGGLFIKLIRTP
jgi:stearoyl-CoA desaturase (delta-9 desaturase)